MADGTRLLGIQTSNFILDSFGFIAANRHLSKREASGRYLGYK